MALSEHAASLLATFSLLTATISYLISPNLQKSFLQGVKWNIWFFSPFRSGAIATNVVTLLIGYRMLNIAETHVGLALLVHNGFPPHLGHGSWSCFARRAFLTGATLPLYMMLLASTQDRTNQVITTSLIAQTMLAELSTIYSVASYELREGWPRRVLVEGSVFSADRLTQDHGKNKGEASRSEKRNEHRNIAPTPVLTDNLCDRIRQLSLSAAEPYAKPASQSFPLGQTSKLKMVYDPNVPAQWTCGHWRCLIYVILHISVRAICWSWSLIEVGSTTWLLHCELGPVILQLAGRLLEGNILNGVLSTLYDFCAALFIFLFVYIASILLVIRLLFFTPLVTRLVDQIHILQRIQWKFQDLAEVAPIIYQVLKALIILFLPGISSYYGALALASRAIGLTQEKLSCVLEIILILILYITVYRLAVVSEPNAAPDSSSNTTGSGPAHSDQKENTGWAESGFPQNPEELFSVIFRLSIVVPTLAVWIFLYR
ncbi:uncharacterized protein N7487_009080 [Penicillium crustosum]|uniref:uncharacterized protein n=1 Tax=Penicillium crustosum TaxID=36656 RepID=UPI002398CD71|nr:uncharacterized protein N7487_009080 [Penicillium crustosum]KAJ5394777.1 hypothetical protein N7487_009080 [Penicillium crustosum]